MEDAKVWLDYDDGTRFVWAGEFKTEGGTTFMYVYNPDNPEFWVFSEDPSDQVSAVPTSSTTFTSDSDMTSNIVNGTWYDLHYKYPDGSTGSMNEIVLSFSTDGAFSESINGEEGIGTWYIDGGNLYLTYTNTDEKYYYPIRIEYVADSDSYLLYYDDLEEGYEGGYWVFTTYEP